MITVSIEKISKRIGHHYESLRVELVGIVCEKKSSRFKATKTLFYNSIYIREMMKGGCSYDSIESSIFER